MLRLGVLPLYADTIAARASLHAQQGDFRVAADELRSAAALVDEAEYHLLLTQLSEDASERAPEADAAAWLDQAERSLDNAARLNPLELDVVLAQGKLHQLTASLLHRPAELAAAEDAYHRALALSPRRSYVLNRYGSALASQGRHDEALALYRSSAELDGRYAATYGFMGDSLVATGRYQEAVDAYRRAAELDPRLVLVQINLGETYLRLGRVGDAIDAYSAAVKASPQDPALQRRLGELRNY